MSDDLPDKFDLIVIGTGFPESCVAAAASRVGKTVLHIDPNEYYGGVWSSFNLESFCTLLEQGSNSELRNASQKWHVAETLKREEVELDTVNSEVADETDTKADATKQNTQDWSRETLLKQSRRFNLDLSPKILYSAGRLVQLLVSSNICRYAEFRAVDRVCTRFQNNIINVPCSRSDVFNTKDLNIVEKRLLMKFLTLCMTYGEDKTDEDSLIFRGKTFREYLQEQKVTEKISTCVMQAIAMCTDETAFEEGMARTQQFLNSLGRYGNTPFLFPMYGCGEIPQCFCRLCAVFGGIYCLKRQIDDITLEADTNIASVVLEGKTIKAQYVVSAPGHLPNAFLQRNVGVYGQGDLVNSLSRGIFLTSTPLGSEELNAGGGGVNLLRLLYGTHEAILIQLSHFSGTCPKGVFLFHITTTAQSDQPEQDLAPFVAQVFNPETENAPKLLYSAYFTIMGRRSGATTPNVDAATPIFCTSAPHYELDYDKSIINAREIFAKLYEDAEFLPRAPDPEEIVIEGEDPRALSENSLPDDLREQLRELENSAENMDIEDAEDATLPGERALEDTETQEMDAD
ncbi:rab proteins geranylgeranyltransferase component A [Zeugodacus cucurbitae]|uniref:rab proteins geranylgeranyltransferase component A n=1 Tax=Zeugodacus cucurbitae TaxID=28588 RepID=UPI0023D8F3C5|nr:rab proteins geranylgeranyltransferase component A [Zeugodacus cucurbitae]